MATAAQTRANQVNAKKSTGPRTEAGKAKVAANHITDGLFIRRHVILPDEDFAEYDTLLTNSTGKHQTALAECEWRIRRCQRAEAIHRREKFRLQSENRTQSAVATSNPIPASQPPALPETSKPIGTRPAKSTHFETVTSNPIPPPPFNTSKPVPSAVTSNPISTTPTPTITYGLPPRYVQELRQLKRTQSTIDPTRDQSRLSPSLRLYLKDRNHLAQAKQLLKSAV